MKNNQLSVKRIGKGIFTLKERREIAAVFNQGRSYKNHHFVLYALPTEKSYSRVVFCVGKKIGTAVRRNRIRRRVRSAFSELKVSICPGFDLALIARNTVYEESFMGIVSSLQEILKKAGIFN